MILAAQLLDLLSRARIAVMNNQHTDFQDAMQECNGLYARMVSMKPDTTPPQDDEKEPA